MPLVVIELNCGRTASVSGAPRLGFAASFEFVAGEDVEVDGAVGLDGNADVVEVGLRVRHVQHQALRSASAEHETDLQIIFCNLEDKFESIIASG